MAQPQNQNSDSIGIDPQIMAQLNKLTGNLSPTQQSWLGGYLTGMAAQGGIAPATPEEGGDHVLTILYGSQKLGMPAPSPKNLMKLRMLKASQPILYPWENLRKKI